MLRLHYASGRQDSHDSHNIAHCGVLVIFFFLFKKVSEYDQEIPQSQTANNLMAP